MARASAKNNCHRGDPGGKCCIQLWGALFFALGFAVCVWTESAYITKSRALREAMAHTEPVALDELEAYYRAHPSVGDGEPRLVHTSGHLRSHWLATDTELGVGVRAVRLRRKVWMYQKWTEKKGGNNSGKRTVVGWREEAPSDDMLSSTAGNPPMLLHTTSFTARDTRLGPFEVDSALLDGHVTWWRTLPCTNSVAAAIASAVSDSRREPTSARALLVSEDVARLVGARGVRPDPSGTGYCLMSHDNTHVQIGDYRIAFEFAVPTGVRAAPLFARPGHVSPLTASQLAPVEMELPAVTDFWWRTVSPDDDANAISMLALIEPFQRGRTAPDDDDNGDGQPDALPVRFTPYHAQSSNGVIGFVVSHADGDEASSAAGMFIGALRDNRRRTLGGRVLAFFMFVLHGGFNYIDWHWATSAPWAPSVWSVVKLMHCALNDAGYGLGILLLAYTFHFGSAALVWLLHARLIGYALLCVVAALLPWVLHRRFMPAAYDRLKDN